jgi:hypothetical protein
MSDENPDLIAQLDQAIRGMKDIARVTWAVYDEHREAGFSKREAFDLAKSWFLTTVTNAKEAE